MNYIISFNLKKNTAHIECPTEDKSKKKFEYLYEKNLEATGSFDKIFESAIERYEQIHGTFPPASSFSVVLPGRLFTNDLVGLPNFGRLTLGRSNANALKTEIEKMYSNYDELETTSTLLKSNKKNEHYYISACKKATLDCIRAAAMRHGVEDVIVIPQPVAIASAVYESVPSLLNCSQLVVDVRESETELVLLSDKIMIGSEIVPIGTAIINAKDKLDERKALCQSTAEMIVLNSIANSNYERKNGRSSEFRSNDKDSSKHSMPIKNFEVLEKYIYMFIAASQADKLLSNIKTVYINISDGCVSLVDSLNKRENRVYTYKLIKADEKSGLNLVYAGVNARRKYPLMKCF